MALTNAALYRQEWRKSILRLIGEHPARSIISSLARPVKGAGEDMWIPGIDAFASDDATSMANSTLDTLKQFYQRAGGDQTFANWLKTITPFNNTVKITSRSTADLIEWGNTWNVNEDGDWISIVNPQSADMGVCAQKIYKKLDTMFGLAITASSVERKVGATAVASISLPASQTMADLTYATADVDSVPAMINETLGNAYLSTGMPVYCGISTTLARHLKKNSSEELRSRDFVDSYEFFKKGVLPKVEGVTFIVLPKHFMESIKANEGTGSGDRIDHYFAWTPDAMASVAYQPLRSDIDVSPINRFQEIGYVRQLHDYVRTDDKGVVLGDIVVA